MKLFSKKSLIIILVVAGISAGLIGGYKFMHISTAPVVDSTVVVTPKIDTTLAPIVKSDTTKVDTTKK